MRSTPLGRVVAVPFPGHIVKVGDSDSETVKQIQHRLTGAPLKIDGQVGSITWGVMFGASSVPSSTVAPSALTKAVIDFALTQIGVREKPPLSNRGPQVDKYIKSVGLDPPQFWCVAFTYFCYETAAKDLGAENPHIKTAGVLDHWQKAKSKPNVVRVTKAKAVADPGLVTAGSLFIIDHGGGFGHSGIVTEVANGRLMKRQYQRQRFQKWYRRLPARAPQNCRYQYRIY